MEYLNATRNYLIMKIKGMTYAEFSEEAKKFGITEKDLGSNMFLCSDASDNDYIVMPVDNVHDWQFMDERQFRSAFLVTNSTEWRK